MMEERSKICRMNTSIFRLYFAFIMLLAMPIAEAVTYANTAQTFNWIDSSTHAKLGPVYGGLYSPTYRFNNTGGCGTTPPTLDDTGRPFAS